MKTFLKLSIALISTLVIFNSCTKTPVACITLKDNSLPYAGDTVFFTNCSLDGNDYFWDFGDGSTSTERNPNHVFQVAGSHSVLLTVTTDNGKKSNTIIYPIFILVKIPKQITITKVVLTEFPKAFVDPNIFMMISVDSINILANNQIYYDCKQGEEYIFSDGFPLIFNQINGNFDTVKFEFLDFKGPNDFAIIGYQSVFLNAIYYAPSGYNMGHYDCATLTGIKFQIYFELEF